MQGFLLVLCVVVQTSRPRPTFAADVLLMLEVRTQAFCGRGHFASGEVQKTKCRNTHCIMDNATSRKANKPYKKSCALAVAVLFIWGGTNNCSVLRSVRISKNLKGTRALSLLGWPCHYCFRLCNSAWTDAHPLIKRQQGQQLVLGPLVLGGHFATICSGGPLHLDPALATFTPEQPST